MELGRVGVGAIRVLCEFLILVWIWNCIVMIEFEIIEYFSKSEEKLFCVRYKVCYK